MLSSVEIQTIVEKYIELRKDYGYLETDFVVPKKAKVVVTTPAGEQARYIEENEHIEQGVAMSHYISWRMRTVFRPEPIIIHNEPHFLEIKGYGASGKDLYPRHHCEGDLFYGMYLKFATEEFNTMQLAHSLNKRTSQGIALLEFSQEEFHRASLQGLASIIPLDKRSEEWPEKEVRAHQLYEHLKQYGSDSLVQRLKGDFKEWQWGLFDALDLPKGPAGYLVRASRCPFRVCEGEAHSVEQTDCEDAVYVAGQTFAKLIEVGILHHVPSQGNITLAGELTDYEDCSRMDDLEEIRKNWRFMAEQFKKDNGNLWSLSDYLNLILGPHFSQKYNNMFLEGINRGKASRDVAESIIDQHRETLGPLLEETVRVV
jgi:hypothetical protein